MVNHKDITASREPRGKFPSLALRTAADYKLRPRTGQVYGTTLKSLGRPGKCYPNIHAVQCFSQSHATHQMSGPDGRGRVTAKDRSHALPSNVATNFDTLAYLKERFQGSTAQVLHQCSIFH